jgi:hypothetical protein
VAASAGAAEGLPHDSVRRLEEILQDLSECRRLIDEAMADGA